MTVNPDGTITIHHVTYTRAEISRSTGISISHVSRIFSGNRMPSLVVAKKLSTYLNITMDQLLVLLIDIRIARLSAHSAGAVFIDRPLKMDTDPTSAA